MSPFYFVEAHSSEMNGHWTWLEIAEVLHKVVRAFIEVDACQVMEGGVANLFLNAMPAQRGG